MDVCLIQIDQEVALALSAGQQVRKLLDEGLPPLRVSPAEHLLGFLTRQLQAVKGSTDRLAAEGAAEALAHKRHEPLEREAWRRVGACYGRGERRTLCGVHDLAKAGLDAGAKGGRPPVR